MELNEINFSLRGTTVTLFKWLRSGRDKTKFRRTLYNHSCNGNSLHHCNNLSSHSAEPSYDYLHHR